MVISPDGYTIKYIDYVGTKSIKADLKVLQDLVGGYVETVALALNLNGKIFRCGCIANEEGKLLLMPVNEPATYLLQVGGVLTKTNFLVGNMVILGPISQHGWFSTLPQPAMEAITDTLDSQPAEWRSGFNLDMATVALAIAQGGSDEELLRPAQGL